MPTVGASIRINAPVDVVVAVLLDADKAPLWTSGLDRLELVEGSVGEPGSIGRAHYQEGDRRYVLNDVLEEVDPGRRYVSRISGGGITARVETVLQPMTPGETRLQLRWSGRGTNPVTWLMLPFMRRRMAERMATDLDALRVLAEGPDAGRPIQASQPPRS